MAHDRNAAKDKMDMANKNGACRRRSEDQKGFWLFQWRHTVRTKVTEQKPVKGSILASEPRGHRGCQMYQCRKIDNERA